MAGRPRGLPKTGGRTRGTPNKPTFDTRGVSSPDGRMTPLQYMLGILNDPDMPDKHRKWAARAAMPYCHPKLRAALADTLRGVTVEIRQFTDEEALAELDALGDPQGRAARMQAAESAAPYCHARPQPAATNAGGVDVQVRHVTHEQRLAELDALAKIDAQVQPMEQAPTMVSASTMDRMEAEWFNVDNPGPAPAPALPRQMSAPTPLPAPTPTPPPPLAPPQPPAPALAAVPNVAEIVKLPTCNLTESLTKPLDPVGVSVPCETGHVDHHGGLHPHHGNGTGQVQRANGASHPRRVNGPGSRHRPQTPPGERRGPRSLRDYPATHPVHGIV